MTSRRTAHAAYGTAYYLVWSPKYRKKILQGAIAERVREMFAETAERYDIAIEEMEVSIDHVHIFREYPRVKRQLWGGEFWEDRYFARTAGDKVTAEVIRQYIQHHRSEKESGSQFKLFD